MGEFWIDYCESVRFLKRNIRQIDRIILEQLEKNKINYM